MKTRVTEKFIKAARKHGYDEDVIAAKILKEFEPDILYIFEFGLPITESLGEDVTVREVINAISKALDGAAVPADIFLALDGIIVIDNGDCPICGGYMDWERIERYDFEDKFERTCPYCGHSEIQYEQRYDCD